MFSICLTSTTVIADAASLYPKIEEADYVEVLENEISSGQGGYTYNAPEPGAFMIENAFGTLSITNGNPVLQFDGYTITLPMVDYYKIVDTNGSLRFYQADVLEDQLLSNNFVYIAVYVENGTDYTLHAQYMDDIEEKMHNIVVPLSTEQFTFFSQMSTPLCIGSDDVSSRLKLSARAYTYGSFAQNTTATTYYFVETMALNPISNGTFDSYTNDDGIIHDYVDEYFGEGYLEDGSTYTDDPIVRIVPKELFFIPGEHIYVGKEYGFFLRVVDDSYSIVNYVVDVMVFDITHSTPGFLPAKSGGARIDPLFQFKYRATDGTYDEVDPSLDRVIIPHIAYDYAEYFLKDVGFKFTLENVDALNPGDTDYNPYEDDGAFITHMYVSANGVSTKGMPNGFFEDTALFAIGLVPHIGTLLSIASYIHDVYNGFGNGEYYNQSEDTFTSDEIGKYELLETNNTDQIARYNGLVKAYSVCIKSDDNEPRLIHVGGGYASASYDVSRKSYSDNNKIRVITSINVNVVETNSSVIFGNDVGITSFGSATGNHETGNYKRLNDTSPNGIDEIVIPAGTQRHIIRMTPLVSGSYKIITSSSSGDPNFYITNATKGTTAVEATDDISSLDRDAELIVDLIAGDIYYIEAFNYNKNFSYTLRIGYNPVSTQTLTENAPFSVSTTKGTLQMLKFTPTESGYYAISTNRTSGDPQIFVFWSSGVLKDSDDDSGGNLNAHINTYLAAGNTYYIAVQGYKGNSADLSITASLTS